ncbi:uncharacterized protein PG986_004654 [Apiospora aurea]|uniref:CENP-V/GFA domain-containing protein n=1 Tax=Apiospora aurea TaxID=335848 RepID=A0ABR1QNZ1_9PEZI
MSQSVGGMSESTAAALLSKGLNHDKAAPSGPHETTKVAAQCHCGAVTFSVSLPVASLPLRGYMCHCSICRHAGGTYARIGVVLPPGVRPDWAGGSMPSDKTTSYEVPGRPTPQFFCSTCGSTIGGQGANGQWSMPVSLFDSKFWEIRVHGFPKSVPDGGLLEWLLPDATAAGAAGAEEIIWFSPDHGDSFVAAEPERAADGSERLRAECHCGGVSFTIPRPSQAVRDDAYLRDYVSPSDPMKWKAFLDLCRDCGRLSGATVVPWMLVPRVVIEPPVPADLGREEQQQHQHQHQHQQQQQQQPYGTLKTYKSSAPNTRGFCGVCGATALLATEHREPTAAQAVLNVAMGLLRAPEGVKAADWVTWRAGKPAWAEDAKGYDEEFTVSLVEGHRRWGVEKYGEAPEFDVI